MIVHQVYIYVYKQPYLYIQARSWPSRVYSSQKEMKQRKEQFFVSRSFHSPKTLTKDCKQHSCQMNDCKRSCLREETVNISILQELLSLEERLGHVNRGATQDVIEMNTLPYKYKKVSFFGGKYFNKGQLFYYVCNFN